MIGNKKHFLIAGASGLIGSSLLQMLLNHPEVGKVSVLVRNPLPLSHKKLQQREIDFDLFTEKDIAPNVDAVFCCLGTTMANAGSRDAFRKVDYEYVITLAVFCQRTHVPQFHVVSAAGASSKSRIFYNQVKGRMEHEVSKLKKIPSIYIYRPSMLLGNRQEFRLGEAIGKFFMKGLALVIPKKYKAIYDIQVAHSMMTHALKPTKGTHIIDNKMMLEMH